MTVGVPRSLASRPRAPSPSAGGSGAAATIPSVSLLAVEIGNSNVKLGLFDGERLTRSWRSTWRPGGGHGDSPGETPLRAGDLIGIGRDDLARIEAVAIASVVPSLTGAFRQFGGDALGVPTTVVEPADLRALLRVELERPDEVGVDRLLNALALTGLVDPPAIVIDLGTATTFDVVAHDGAFVGGAIAAGPGVVLDALRRAAPRLPEIELRRPPRAIGRDAVSAMQSGLVNGYIGLLSGLLTALRAEVLEQSPAGSRVVVVATGGHSGHPWVRELPGIDLVQPHLTLLGLQRAYAGLATRARVPR